MERQELVQLINKKVKPLIIGDAENKIITECLNLINKEEEKQLILSGVIERAFYAGREITSTEERGMLFEHVYKEFTDYKKDVL